MRKSTGGKKAITRKGARVGGSPTIGNTTSEALFTLGKVLRLRQAAAQRVVHQNTATTGREAPYMDRAR